MKDENRIESLESDFVYSPLIVLSIQQYAKRYNENKIPNEIIYNTSYRYLQNLGMFADRKEDDPTSYAASLNIYNIIYEDSIKKLEENGIVDIEDGKVLLPESGLKIYNMLMEQLHNSSKVDLLNFFSDEISKFNEKIDRQSEKVTKERKELVTSLRRIGSQMDQYFPNFLSRLEKKLLFAIIKNKEFTSNEINKFSAGFCHGNSTRNALKRMESNGFVKNYGHGLVEYKLTKLGKAQAKWYAGREIS